MIKRKATLRDLFEAADNLCASDLQEFHCMKANRCPRDVLGASLDENTTAIVVGSLVLAVGGYGPGNIWFVTTNVIHALSKAERIRFYRILKDHYKALPEKQNYRYSNYVSVDNKPHIRLLESLGATFEGRIAMSPAGFAFKQFWL
ncbi:MAG: phage protein Gp13 family protein [Pseudomonas sp.]